MPSVGRFRTKRRVALRSSSRASISKAMKEVRASKERRPRSIGAFLASTGLAVSGWSVMGQV